MPSKKRQINIRMDDEGFDLLASLVERMKEKLGIEVSQSDAVRAGLCLLDREYPKPQQEKAKRGKA